MAETTDAALRHVNEADATADALSSSPGGCLPTPEQELLLDAALAHGDSASRAFRTWAEAGWMDHLDEGSFRLLPLVYRNLRSHGIQHPLMPTLRGIHRRAWCKNQLLWSDLAQLLATFEDSGIPTMVLKGPVLALRHYGDGGARPTRDLDIAVPEACAEQAFKLVIDDGWMPMSWMPPRFKSAFRGVRHAIALRNSSDRELDLHWHILWQCCARGADEEFWSRASTFEIGGRKTRVLDPTDQLLHACAHGMMWNPVPPVRWIADAVVITRSAEIDWSRLAREIRVRRLVLLCRTALQYLHDRFTVPVPSGVLDELRDTPVTRGEEMEFVRLTDPDRLLAAADTIRAVWHQSSRSAEGGPWSRAMRFVRYQQYQWFEPTLGSAGRTALRWAFSRTIRRPRGGAIAGLSASV